MFDQLKELLVEKLDVNEETITMETSFKEDLGVDSLDLFDLVMALEDQYGVEIPSEELETITTVGKMVEYLEKKGVK